MHKSVTNRYICIERQLPKDPGQGEAQKEAKKVQEKDQKNKRRAQEARGGARQSSDREAAKKQGARKYIRCIKCIAQYIQSLT